MKIEKIAFLKKCSTHAKIDPKGTKMISMSSGGVLAQLVFMLQQGLATVYLILHCCHIFRKSVIVKENLSFILHLCIPFKIV